MDTTLNVSRFYPLPSLNLLSRHVMTYPTVDNLAGMRSLLQQRHLVNHVPNLLCADAGAAFLSGKVLQDSAVGQPHDSADEDENLSAMDLCTATNSRPGQVLGDTLPQSWPLFTRNEPAPTVDPAALHGVGVFQRLLAFMSRRASLLDNIQKRNAQHSPFGRSCPLNSHGMMSLDASHTPECPSGAI